jgi:CRP-like cAMP-binding protein
MESFFNYIRSFMHLSGEGQELLAGQLQRLELPKGHLLVRAGTVCHYIYFIETGLTRTFYVKEGKDVTDWISPENSIACSIVSFLTRRPDVRNIELLEPSVLWALAWHDLEKLYSRSHEIDRLGRLLVSNGLIQMQQRFDDLHFATAQERYHKLLDEYPTLVQRVPLGMIASYLGITQETLSRIRAKK